VTCLRIFDCAPSFGSQREKVDREGRRHACSVRSAASGSAFVAAAPAAVASLTAAAPPPPQLAQPRHVPPRSAST
jgi:hypothetical protein